MFIDFCDFERSTLTNLSQPVSAFTYRLISLWRTPAGLSLNLSVRVRNLEDGVDVSATSGLVSFLFLSERIEVVLLRVAREISLVILMFLTLIMIISESDFILNPKQFTDQ